MLYGFRQDNEYYLATIVHECGMAVSYGKAFFVVPIKRLARGENVFLLACLYL